MMPDDGGRGRIEAEEDEQFFLSGGTEIAFALNDLIHRGELVTVSFNRGGEMILTTLLALDREEDRLIFDWGGSETASRRLLASERSVFVANPEGIKVQFICGAVFETTHGGRKAFATGLPDHVVRLQRRESYRVATPVGRPLLCRVESAAEAPGQYPLHDLSVGGFAFTAPVLPASWQAGAMLDRVHIMLPEFGEVAAAAEIRHVTRLDPRGSAPAFRVGCRFADLPHAMDVRIQRYIVALERTRRSATPD